MRPAPKTGLSSCTAAITASRRWAPSSCPTRPQVFLDVDHQQRLVQALLKFVALRGELGNDGRQGGQLSRLALENARLRARGSTSQLAEGGGTGGAEPGASAVALRAACDASGSDSVLTACIGALGCWLFVIPTSLRSELSEGGAAGHIGKGGTTVKASTPTFRNSQPMSLSSVVVPARPPASSKSSA